MKKIELMEALTNSHIPKNVLCNSVCIALQGSRSYGTYDSDSDYDIKLVYVMKLSDIVLSKKMKVTNYKLDNNIEVETYPIQIFIRMLNEGQIIPMDIVNTDVNDLLFYDDLGVWDFIVNNKGSFINRNIKKYVEFAFTQVSRYHIKKERLKKVLEFYDILTCSSINHNLKHLWDSFPNDKDNGLFHIGSNRDGVKEYKVMDKVLQETMRVDYAMSILDVMINKYGKRVKNNLERSDFKSVSHAYRALFEVKELLNNGCIKFPLNNRIFLRDIIDNKYDFQSLCDTLLNLLPSVEKEIDKLKPPHEPDSLFLNTFIRRIYIISHQG